MRKNKTKKSALLALTITVASLLAGIEVAAYLTVPNIAMSAEGDALVLFDPEIGAIAKAQILRVKGGKIVPLAQVPAP